MMNRPGDAVMVQQTEVNKCIIKRINGLKYKHQTLTN